MGKTQRDIGRKMHRKPKGAKQAKASGARAVPPSHWDDLAYAAQREACRPVERYLETRVGKSWEATCQHIAEKYGDNLLHYVRKTVGRSLRRCSQEGRLHVDDGVLRKYRRKTVDRT